VPSSERTDPPRETKPQEVGDFGPRSSVCAGFSGRVRANVIQVMVSSNWVEDGSVCEIFPAAAVRWESGKRGAFSKAAVSPSFPPLRSLANSAGVRSASDECGRRWL
jgi:hypothetical protein